jgi:small neutral amino acid transporter SnatA (MarC family)
MNESTLIVTEVVFGVIFAAVAVQLMLEGLADLSLIELIGH